MNQPKVVLNLLAALLLSLISVPASIAAERPLPVGWRMPNSLELSEGWRLNAPDRNAIVHADFNDDGIADEAMILVSVKGERFGLFAYLSQTNSAFKLYRVYVNKHVKELPAMGIEKVLSGKYMTACGKGYWSCKKGETPQIVIEGEAIHYFKTESASSYFYWDKKAKRFKRIWISD
jgi:hypothetical protein